MAHIPVLLKETIGLLEPRPGKIFIDATFGEGGHASAILEKILPGGRMLALDANREAIELGRQILRKQINDKTLILVQGNFSELTEIAAGQDFPAADGILFDLGLSSTILDEPKRGFSFQKDGPLDMRFDRASSTTAADILNHESEKELLRIFREFGEERFSQKIARAVVSVRKQKNLNSTSEFFDLIKSAMPARFRQEADHTARRIFQALRIAVNQELKNLKAAMPGALELLRSGGRLAVISFHSLEDRIVKQTFATWAKPCICPPEFPVCVCKKNPLVKILTTKPVRPPAAEIENNRRSASAKLRVIEKL